jgi:uncharacterized protein (DUF3084 family)
MGMIDEQVIHTNCLMQIENLNQQLQMAQQDVTNISLEKNKFENEVISLRQELSSLKNSSIKNVKNVKNFEFY